MEKWTIPSKPNQLITRAYGIGKEHDIALADINNGIMMMDAPELLPAGSMYRKEQPSVDRFSACETLTGRGCKTGWDNYRFGKIRG